MEARIVSQEIFAKLGSFSQGLLTKTLLSRQKELSNEEVPTLKKRGAATAFVLALLISAIAATLPIVKVGAEGSVVSGDWPMFGYDASHSGCPDNIAPVTHDLLWSFNTLPGSDDYPSIISGSPAVVGGVVYVGSDDGVAFALNAVTGSCIWSSKLGTFTCGSPAVVYRVLYTGSDHNGEIIALNASTGEQIWSYATISRAEAPPVVVKGAVYAISSNGNLYALNATTGECNWTCRTSDGNAGASPAVYRGIVYAGANNSGTPSDNRFYALNASTGAQIWNYSTGSYIRASAAVANGVIYVGAGNGNIYAIGTPQPSPSTTPNPSPSPSPTPSTSSTPNQKASPSSNQPPEDSPTVPSPSTTPTTPDKPPVQKTPTQPVQQTPTTFPSLLVAVTVASLSFVGSGLLVYFKKSRQHPQTGKTPTIP
jgi:hypothetical protein